jgi:hypothetical protein
VGVTVWGTDEVRAGICCVSQTSGGLDVGRRATILFNRGVEGIPCS